MTGERVLKAPLPWRGVGVRLFVKLISPFTVLLLAFRAIL
jgi:hypothetical protein